RFRLIKADELRTVEGLAVGERLLDIDAASLQQAARLLGRLVDLVLRGRFLAERADLDGPVHVRRLVRLEAGTGRRRRARAAAGDGDAGCVHIVHRIDASAT